MSNVNPYASPHYGGQPLNPTPMAGPPVGVWRQGDKLVMHRQFYLPDVCVFTGQPASPTRLEVYLQYDPPWLRAMVLLLGWLLYSLLSQGVSQRTTIRLPVSEEILERRWTFSLLGAGICVLGVLLFAGGIALLANKLEGPGVATMLLGVFTLIGGIITWAVMLQTVSCHFMDDFYVWISGAGEDYLRNLPAWPFPPK